MVSIAIMKNLFIHVFAACGSKVSKSLAEKMPHTVLAIELMSKHDQRDPIRTSVEQSRAKL